MYSVFSAASCPQCSENADCYNSTHCICKDGFWTGPDSRIIIEPHVKCEGKEVCLHLFSVVVINSQGNLRRKGFLSVTEGIQELGVRNWR